ncbi:hypothetical protein GCM10017687_79680 [Streptomyces echinatus]
MLSAGRTVSPRSVPGGEVKAVLGATYAFSFFRFFSRTVSLRTSAWVARSFSQALGPLTA